MLTIFAMLTDALVGAILGDRGGDDGKGGWDEATGDRGKGGW